MIASFRLLIVCTGFAVLLFSSDSAYAAAGNPDYELTDTLNLSGPTRWDYLTFDPNRQRLFITRNERVDVLDLATRKITGSISGMNGAHGVALALPLNTGFISNGKANTVTAFDLATLQITATIPTEKKPDAVVYDPATQLVFVANADSDSLTVIDAKNKIVSATVKLAGNPEFMALDDKERLYVNLENKAEMAVVDTKTFAVLANYNLAPNCDGPTGLSIDLSRHHLFASCANKVMPVVDAANGKIIDTLPIGDHSDATLFDPTTKRVFSSNGDGTLTVIGSSGEGHYGVLQTAKTRPTARTMALNPSTHEIYLVAAETEGFDPPTTEHPKSRPHIKPDTFMVLTMKPTAKN